MIKRYFDLGLTIVPTCHRFVLHGGFYRGKQRISGKLVREIEGR